MVFSHLPHYVLNIISVADSSHVSEDPVAFLRGRRRRKKENPRSKVLIAKVNLLLEYFYYYGGGKNQD